MHQRLSNEFLLRLARRAVSVIAPCLREEEMRDAFVEFHAAFKEELIRYEYERERMAARLSGRQIRKIALDDSESDEVRVEEKDRAAGEKP